MTRLFCFLGFHKWTVPNWYLPETVCWRCGKWKK